MILNGRFEPICNALMHGPEKVKTKLDKPRK